MAGGPRVGQIHGDLGVFDPARGAGVLALRPDGVGALLHVAGLIDDQYRLVIAEMVDHIGAQIIAHPVGVPLRPRQQMLQPVRAGVTTALGQRPTVLAVDIRHQPQHQRARVPQRLAPGESRRDPIQHLIKAPPPLIDVYAMSRGDRGIILSLVLTNSERCRGHRPYQRKHADKHRSRRVGGWRGGEWFGCRSGRSCRGFPAGSFRFDRGRYRFRFQPPPVKPCMRFSRTRLTDVLHRRHSAFQARNGLGGTTIPSRLIRPRWLGEFSTWVIPQPRARRRLPRLDSHSASRVKA